MDDTIPAEEVIITVNEEITYTTTEEHDVFEWVNTGKLYNPVDYSEQIEELSDRIDNIKVPTKVSELTNDKNFIALSDIPTATDKVAGLTVVYPQAQCTTYTSDVGTVTPAAVKKAVTMFGMPKEGGDITGHLYLTGAKPSSSTGNTSQIIFGTKDDEHVALSSNTSMLVINPNSTSSANQILLSLGGQSKFPKGIAAGGVSPYSNNTYTLGTSSLKWSNVYATTFTGNLSGTASKATADASGNNIANTYATKDNVAKKVDKDSLSLGIHTDGLLYTFVDGVPVGDGVSGAISGDEVEETKEITIETTAGGYYNTSGGFISSSDHTAYKTNLIPVTEGDQFVYTGFAYNSNVSVIWYVTETTVLSSEAYQAHRGAVMVTAPQGANYARFYSLSGSGVINLFGLEAYYVPKTLPYEIVISTKDDGYFDYNNGSGYRWSSTSGQSKYTNSIPVEQGDQFDYTGFSKWSISGVVWSDSSGNPLSNEQYNDGGSGATTVRVTAPAGAAFVRFFSFSYGTATLVVTKITKESEEAAMLNSNVLWGKKYVACGDSFTEGAYSSKTDETWSEKFQTYKTYPFWIAERNNMNLVNEAKSGSDFTNISGASNAFSVSRYTAVPTDADYITLMFGLNETGIGDDSALIGTSADTTNATLWGAYNIVFEHFLTNMPYAKIGVIIADAWMTANYANAVKEICKYWGIPYLDLKGDDVPMGIGGRYSTTSSKARQLRNNAFQVSADDSHPNVKAHEYRSTIIENFLRSL
jgi:lysophospholipase L1-like esterase